MEPPEPGPAVETDPLAEIGYLGRAVSMFQGGQLAAIAAFVHTEMAAAAAGPAPGWSADVARQSAEAEVALMLGVAAPTGRWWVQLALGLAERLPATLAALRAGAITLAKARAMLAETASLSVADAARIEGQLLGRAPGLTAGNLRRAVRKAVIGLDPDAAAKRRDRAEAARDVTFVPAEDGMARLDALLAAEDAIAVFGVLDTYARAATDGGDERPIGARRADALVDLILRPGAQPARAVFAVRVTIPARTRRGQGEEAADLAGYGPIPAQTARGLAADAASWTATLVDPDTGEQIDAGTQVDAKEAARAADRYVPSARLARSVRDRDRHCRFPGCRMPAWRCDLDHTISFTIGGKTITTNLAAVCRRHHRIKHLPGWRCDQGPRGELTWTTPTGRVYLTRPPTPTGDETPQFPAREPPAREPHDANGRTNGPSSITVGACARI